MICKFISNITLLQTIMGSLHLQLASCYVTLGPLLNFSGLIISFKETISITHTPKVVFRIQYMEGAEEKEENPSVMVLEHATQLIPQRTRATRKQKRPSWILV